MSVSIVTPRVAIVQDGARLHYAIPLALQRRGLLERMYTEWFIRPGGIEGFASAMMRLLKPALGRAMAGRRCDELHDNRIVTNPLLAWRERRAASRFKLDTDYFRWCSRQVAEWVGRVGPNSANVLMGYVRNIDPDLLRDMKARGCRLVCDQIIAPAAVELAEARKQNERWPGWQTHESEAELTAYRDWEEQTWPLLDHVTCASDYVRDGLVSQGVDSSKISVLPYPIDVTHIPTPDRRGRSGAITVGFVGAVNLRKGAPWFFEIARRFDPEKVRFVMVGPVDLSEQAVAKHRGYVELIGRVDRSQVADWLESFDIFLFPSTCEGSAGAVMEAMASGLPIVTSPSSGSVVRDGEDGFIRAYDDVDGMTERVEALIEASSLRAEMSASARKRAEQFNLDWYSTELARLLEQVVA